MPLVALLALLLAGCSMPAPTGSLSLASPTLRFLALGDSYTVGEGVPTRDTWPHVVARRLRADGVSLVDPTGIATTGWTTDELDAAITERERDLAPPYDVVTLLIGVNDQYRGRDAEDFRAPFRALLARAAGFAGDDASRVVVVSIPDWGVTPFAEGQDRAQIATEIDAFNAVAQDEARVAGARWADVTPHSRAHPALVADDGLHPSGEAYAGWAEVVAPEIQAALGR